MNTNTSKWLAFLLLITFVFLLPTSHNILMGWTKEHPYFMGFCKFAILAFLGELMGLRISSGEWKRPNGIGLRIVSWGLMGMMIAFVLPLSGSAILIFKQQGILSVSENSLLYQYFQALLASVVFNIIPGPMVIIYHKLAESYIELSGGKVLALRRVHFADAIRNIDWVYLIRSILLKINLILFIPINTIVFLLPQDQRVLIAAYSSILLGIVLGYHKAHNIRKTI